VSNRRDFTQKKRHEGTHRIKQRGSGGKSCRTREFEKAIEKITKRIIL
jgi:hypothetical protein